MELGGVILPPELERAVFETAALLDPKNVPTLLLVAQRLHTWLQPFLYRVLVYSESAINPLHRMPPLGGHIIPARSALLENYVLNLAFQSWHPRTLSEIQKLLALCTGVRNLACYFDVNPSFIPYLGRIRPLSLSINVCELFAGAPDFSHTMFANITHLELVDDDVSLYTDGSWKSLTSLPCLTHLAVNSYYSFHFPAYLLHMLLGEAKLLQVLILTLVEEILLENTDDPMSAYPTHDPRFVVTVCRDYMADWVRGAWGGADIWVRADNFIYLKRRGDISKDVYFLADDCTDVELFDVETPIA